MTQQENEIEITNNSANMNLEYDAISPITGNKCVLIEADETTNQESRICMETGYTTKDIWKIDSKVVNMYEQRISQLMIDTKYIDKELDQVWYLASMTTPTTVLYPVGNDNTNYHFEVAKIISIDGEERLNYPVPGKDGEYYTSKLDTENAFPFAKNEFAIAMDKFYSIITEEVNED